MDSEIVNNLARCSLSEEETIVLQVEESDIASKIKECRASILARIHVAESASINPKGFALAMGKAWGIRYLQVHQIASVQFQIFLPSRELVDRLVAQGPWCFDNKFVVIRGWEQGLDCSDARFYWCHFWVHITGFPVIFHSKEFANKLHEAFQGCEAVECRNYSKGAWYFRVRVKVSLLLPLRRVVKVRFHQEVVTGVLSYERLPNLCFFCGKLGHLVPGCLEPEPLEFKRRKLRYGFWIRGDSINTKIKTEFRVAFGGTAQGGQGGLASGE